MNLRIALLMMQKNEDLLLGPWIRYHTNFTANSSIFIFDNGSSIPGVARNARRSGAGRYSHNPTI
jgi:hypothetical protein